MTAKRSELEVPFKAICIGGPADGETYHLRERLGTFLVPIVDKMQFYSNMETVTEFQPPYEVHTYTLGLTDQIDMQKSNVLLYFHNKKAQ